MGSQYESEKVGKISEQNGPKGLQMVHYEYPRHQNFSVSLRLVSFLSGPAPFHLLARMSSFANGSPIVR